VERLTPEILQAENTRHDRILAGLVLLFAFLLGCYPAQNADVYLSLRTGQMIVHGEFVFGEDPYSYAAHPPQGIVWIQNALVSAGLASGPLEWVHAGWLGDVLIYLVHAVGGGAGLVLLRALLMLATALLLLQLRLRGGSLVVVAAAIALAMLVLSPRMFVRAEMFSPVLLALTLYLLWHEPVRPKSAFMRRLVGWTGNRLWVFLPLLFALWANIDAWFFLGPLAVAVALAGESLHARMTAPRPPAGVLEGPERKRLLLTLIVGLLACLLNPFHVHVFALPAEFGSAAIAIVREHEPGTRLGASPFEAAYFRAVPSEWFRPRGLTISEWGYYLLFVLSAWSFIYNARGFRVTRLLLWFVFFAFSAWRARHSGYFAVVAAPLMAMNFQEGLLAREAARKALTTRTVMMGQLGRAGLLVGLLVLIAALMMPSLDTGLSTEVVHGRRGIGFSLAAPVNVEEAATQWTAWRRSRALPGRAFFVSWQDYPAFWCWYAPGERKSAFVDLRLQLHGNAMTTQYEAMKSLRETDLSQPSAKRSRDWQAIFAKPEFDVSHIVVPYREKARLRSRDPRQPVPPPQDQPPLVEVLLRDRDERGAPIWELLDYVDGDTFVLGWVGGNSPHGAALRKLRFDPLEHAFGAKCVPVPEPDVTGQAAPLRNYFRGHGPSYPASMNRGAWFFSQIQHNIDHINVLRHRDALLRKPDTYMFHLRLAGFLAALPTSTFPWHAFPLTPHDTAFMQGEAPRYAAETDILFLLAARSAREGLAHSPGSLLSMTQMIDVYGILPQMEGVLGVRAGGDLARRDFMRTFALREAARQEPNDFNLHRILLEHCLETNCFDLAVMEYQQCLRILVKFGRDEDGKALTDETARKQMQAVVGNARRFELVKFEQDVLSVRQEFELKRRELFRIARPNSEAVHEIRAVAGQAAQRRQVLITMQLLSVYLELQRGYMGDPNYGEAFRLLVSLARQTGDLLLLEQLVLRPEAEYFLGARALLPLLADVFFARGRNRALMEAHDRLDGTLGREAVRAQLQGGRVLVLGRVTESSSGIALLPSDVTYRMTLTGVDLTIQRARESYWGALAALESGRRDDAIRLLERAAANADRFPGRPVAERYYFYLTGKMLPAPQN
jgi:hypothetical protein